MGQDRRRYPRISVALGISVEALGRQWRGRTIDLSPYGVKIAWPAEGIEFPPGTTAGLRLSLPDGEAPLAFRGRVSRTDADGVAFNFVNPGARDFARLKDLIDSLLDPPSEPPACLEVSLRPIKDRRKGPRVDTELEARFEGEQPYGWRGSNIVNLSPYGMKVTLPSTAIQPAWGTPVRLRLATVDGQPPIAVKAIVWRREPNALALLLVDVGPRELERLKALVEVLQVHGRRRPMVPASV